MTNQSERKFTSKQMGDACEMLVAAELTLSGIPALRVPELWPGYDVIAQPLDRGLQRISVKSRTFKRGPAFVEYSVHDVFDWLAIVLLPSALEARRQIFIIPHNITEQQARRNAPTTKSADGRYWRIDEVESRFEKFRDNFSLSEEGREAVHEQT